MCALRPTDLPDLTLFHFYYSVDNPPSLSLSQSHAHKPTEIMHFINCVCQLILILRRREKNI